MPITGVVLMTYGSPRDLDDVGAYITRVRGGREPGPELLAEFRRRYEVIGMSPLIEITRAQATGLEDILGADFRVAAGMRFSEPSVAAAVDDVRARGAQRLLGLILSPQYSATLMGGYDQAIQSAANGTPGPLAPGI
jgi:ferrochelatase